MITSAEVKCLVGVKKGFEEFSQRAFHPNF